MLHETVSQLARALKEANPQVRDPEVVVHEAAARTVASTVML